MPSTEWFAMPPRFARPKFSLFVVGLITGLAFLALSGAAEQAGAQTTFTCSTATPSNNCAMAITGSATGTTTTPAGLSSSYLTVSGATGPVTSVQVVLNGVTSSVADWAGYNENNENVYSSVFYTTFVLEDPAGNQLALLGSTGSGYDAMNGVTITIKDGATVAPPLNVPNYGGAWPATGSVTVAPSSYWELENIVPLYDSAAADLAQTDGSATLTSKFTGATANGTWTLHLADSDQTIDYPLYVTDPVSISGWQLILTYSNLPSTTTTVSSSVNPTYTASTGDSTTLTATVDSSGEPINGGTVTFTANNSPIACTGGNQTVSGGTATCDAVFTAEGNYSIGASYSGTSSYAPSSGGGLYQLAISHTTNPSTNTYCNPGNLTTTGYTSTDLVYPSYIQVPSGVSQTVANVSVQLNGLQSTNGALSGDVSSSSFLLVSPNETNNLDFLSHGVTGNPQPSVDVTFADGDPLVPNGEGENGGICNGGSGPNCDLQNDTTYGPTDDSLTSDSFITQAGSPAPPSPNYPLPYGSTNAKTFEQAFSGATAAGNWLLYIENDGGIPLSLSGGWCIDLTLNTGAATTTAVTSSKDPDFTGNSVSFTATVQSGGNPVTTGSVTFLDNGEPPTGGNNVITLNGAGQAVFTTSQLTEGDHKISASYGGNSDYNPSQNYVWQRIDDTTAVSGVSGNAAQFCNTGAVLTAEGQTGAFTPNPSNIFVNNLPGTVNTVSLTLDNFYTFSDQIYQIESMVAGPTGAALDFFSNTGASNTVLSSGNYVFTDSASSDVPQTAFGPGSWKPTSYTNIDNTADSFFASASPYYTPPGTFDYAQPHSPAFTLSNVFGSTNPNGTWSLYFDQLLHGSAAGAQNGWCLNFTENPPVVSVVVPSTQTFAQGQQNASFTVDVDNTGPGSTGDPTGGSNPMTVEDGLISVFSYSNFSGTGWSCSANGHLVTCTNDSSVPDGQAYPELTIDVNVSSTASGSYLNSVGVNGAGVGPTPSNNDTITVLANTTTSAFNSETGYGVPAVPLQATVTSSSGAVNSGTVTFTLFSGSTQVGTPTSGAVSNGIAAVFYTLPPGTPPGSYTIQAVYSGSSTFAGSSDSTHTVTMIQAPTTTTASNATTNYSSSPQSVSLSATVTSPVGTVNAGTVTFTVLNGSTPVGTATTSGTVSSGSASVSYTLPAATTIGNYTIQAVYNGSTDFAGSSNNAHTLTVAPSIGSCTTANLNPNPNPESFAAVGDFNGDCRSDLLWHNSSTEQVYEWLMNGTTFTSSGSPGSLTSDWVIQDVGDFNADGKADILWRNSTTGEVVIWLMNGTTMTSSTSLGNVSSDWSIAGVGDYKGDRYADILWQNTSGELYLWLLNGTTIAGGGIVGNVSSGWNVAGIGDFNGDGDADILWRNSTTGQVYVWLMNGTTIASMGSPGTPSSDWSIAGVGDFDGDGKSDILWRNSTTGQAYIWFMNGTTFPSSGSIAFVTSDWSIQGVGDYDGSGRAGILWRNSTSGQVYVWLMNGTTLTSTGSPGTPVAAWQIAP
jgi:hypothetical protein